MQNRGRLSSAMTEPSCSTHCTKMTISTCFQRTFAICMGLMAVGAGAACRSPSSMTAGLQPEVRATSPDAASAPGSSEREHRVPRKLAGDPTEPLACRADADCIITCRTDGSCCLEQCGCSQPMSRTFLARLESHLSRECGPDPLCPVAGCVGTKLYEPACEKGQCAARKLPGGL